MKRPYSTNAHMQIQTVGTLCPGKVLSCAPDLQLRRAISMMRDGNCSSIVIVRENQPMGILTERDILSLPTDCRTAFDEPIENWMSHPVQTISVHASPEAAMVRMRSRGLRHLVTVDDQNCLAGIISQTDLIRQIGSSKTLGANDVEDAIRKSTVFVDANTSIAELRIKMHSEKCDSAIVTGFAPDLPAHQQTGIVTERDILRHMADGDSPTGNTAGDIASRPVLMIDHAESLTDARQMMMQNKIRHLAVLNMHKEFIGVLSFADLLEFIEQDYFAHLRNLTEDRDSELAKARRSQTLAHKLIEISPDCVMICNAHGEIESVNPAFTRVTGYTAEEVIGKNPSILKSGRQGKDFYQKLWRDLLRTGKWEGEIWNRRKSGEIYPEWLSIMAIRDNDGEITQHAAIFTDLSGPDKNREDILRLAHTDELTGMPNRRRFHELLSHQIGRSRRTGSGITLMMLDIDNFQRVNNTLGHACGDDVLIDVSRRIMQHFGQDAVIARTGADEYAAILPDINPGQEAQNLAERLLIRLGEPHKTRKGEDLYLSASIGIASFPQDASDTSGLLHSAEQAMMQAKEQGRNRVSRYSRSLHNQKGADLALETALRRALENKELHLVYQPQFDARTQKLFGVEALVRWTTSEGKVIPPSTFIPIAEQMGVIGELGRWVLRTGCQQLVTWRKQGHHNLRLAVNVSVQQFYGTVDLAEQIRAILVDKGLAADRLEVEVTESLFMRDMDDMRAKLQRIRDLGVNISLDDFGTGFSSLSYLRTLPFDTIKLDRSFVTDIDRGKEGQALATTIVNMAQNLGKMCIAEGVENSRQLDFLRAAGCDLIQGFLLGKPMSADEIGELATRQQSVVDWKAERAG